MFLFLLIVAVGSEMATSTIFVISGRRFHRKDWPNKRQQKGANTAHGLTAPISNATSSTPSSSTFLIETQIEKVTPSSITSNNHPSPVTPPAPTATAYLVASKTFASPVLQTPDFETSIITGGKPLQSMKKPFKTSAPESLLLSTLSSFSLPPLKSSPLTSSTISSSTAPTVSRQVDELNEIITDEPSKKQVGGSPVNLRTVRSSAVLKMMRPTWTLLLFTPSQKTPEKATAANAFTDSTDVATDSSKRLTLLTTSLARVDELAAVLYEQDSTRHKHSSRFDAKGILDNGKFAEGPRQSLKAAHWTKGPVKPILEHYEPSGTQSSTVTTLNAWEDQHIVRISMDPVPEIRGRTLSTGRDMPTVTIKSLAGKIIPENENLMNNENNWDSQTQLNTSKFVKNVTVGRKRFGNEVSRVGNSEKGPPAINSDDSISTIDGNKQKFEKHPFSQYDAINNTLINPKLHPEIETTTQEARHWSSHHNFANMPSRNPHVHKPSDFETTLNNYSHSSSHPAVISGTQISGIVLQAHFSKTSIRNARNNSEVSELQDISSSRRKKSTMPLFLSRTGDNSVLPQIQEKALNEEIGFKPLPTYVNKSVPDLSRIITTVQAWLSLPLSRSSAEEFHRTVDFPGKNGFSQNLTHASKEEQAPIESAVTPQDSETNMLTGSMVRSRQNIERDRIVPIHWFNVTTISMTSSSQCANYETTIRSDRVLVQTPDGCVLDITLLVRNELHQSKSDDSWKKVTGNKYRIVVGLNVVFREAPGPNN